MTEKEKELGSLLGEGSAFKGKLSFFGTVRIEGKLEGDVLSEDTLVVGHGGHVHGTISVGTLIVTGGVVEATVKAAKAVEIHPPGRLSGEVETPTFIIEKGAVFQGNCSMPSEPPEPQDAGDSAATSKSAP